MKSFPIFILLVSLIFNAFAYINPVQGARDSPDPGVFRDVDETYYATTTGGWGGSFFPIWKSQNLGSWTNVGFGLIKAPSWTDGGDFWAP
jgi:beta-xylosidase